MKFKVIDGHDNIDYDSVLTDYQNLELSVQQIREKHGLSMGKWQRITRQFKEEGIPLRNRQRQAERTYHSKKFSQAKNYYYSKTIGKYRIIKCIKGKSYYFGAYENEDDAIDRVNELRENGWNGLLE